MVQSAPTTGRALLWLSPALVVIVVFFASIPWLENLDDAVIKVIAAAVSLFVMAYSVAVAIRLFRRSDEVEQAGERYAWHVGGVGGAILAILLLTVPPVQTLLIEAANVLGTGSPETPDRESVLLALFFGATLLVLVQSLSAAVVRLIWMRRVGWR